MARILVTYGWCRTAYVAVRSLAARGHHVYSCSHLQPAMAGWSRFCRESAGVADHVTAPEAFVADVAALVERWNIDVVMPGHEDALVLREWEHRLPDKLRLACPALESLVQGIDKASLTQLAQQAGVPVPKTCFPGLLEEALEDAGSLGFPLVVKLRRSNSAKGVVVVSSLDGLRAVLEGPMVDAAGLAPGQFPLLQAHHPGAVVGGCFMAREGRLVACFGERYLRAKSNGMGTSVFREPFPSPVLVSHVEALIRVLAWDGIGHFDFIEDPHTGQLVLLEMNPRPWGAINLAYVNGYDFIAAVVASTLGAADPREFFGTPPVRPKRSMWLIGEGIRWIHLVSSHQYAASLRVPLEVLGSLRHTHFDDWLWHDPLPLLAEAVCYARGYISAGGDVNPD